MVTLGEILRWFIYAIGAGYRRAAARCRRVAAWLLRRDSLLAGSERKFSALFESAPDAMVIVNDHGHITLVNAQAEKLFGWSRRELVGQNIGELIPERFRGVHREHVRGYLRDAAPRDMGRELDLYARRKDGSEFPVEISLSPLETDEGLLVTSAIRDISARKSAAAALRAAEERFRTAFEEAPVGMALAGLDGRLLHVNRAMCEITGYAQEHLEATTFASIIHPGDAARDAEDLRRLLSGEWTRYRAERRYIHADGHPVPIDLSVAVVLDAAGEPQHFLAQGHDITERKRFEGQLQHLADHDALTGMFNRRRFQQELERELVRAERYESFGAVLAIDLDHFKYINDALGHSVGDELVMRVGGIFRSCVRETDIIARLGGDEFAVILTEVEEQEALLVAEKLVTAMRDEGRIEAADARPRRVTVSIGVAPFGGPAAQSPSGALRLTSEEVLVEADIAMYDAKEAGRDRVEVYDASHDRHERMHARLTWADRIRDALEADSFVLHAQPILALNDDQVPRHELLIRMQGEDGDVIPPATFLAVAERFDLIREIDCWVLRQSIALLADAKRAGKAISLNVNLSAKSVTLPDLPGWVANELREAGIDGRGLCVEVTETAAIVNVDRAKRFAEELGELGCEFALDDFGAGFASFYYLKHMAFDYVKIDGEFIRGLALSRVNQLVVQSVVDIARGLGKRTIAEYVADEETLQLVKRYGVDYAQGFYVSKPRPLDELDLAQAPAVRVPVN